MLICKCAIFCSSTFFFKLFAVLCLTFTTLGSKAQKPSSSRWNSVTTFNTTGLRAARLPIDQMGRLMDFHSTVIIGNNSVDFDVEGNVSTKFKSTNLVCTKNTLNLLPNPLEKFSYTFREGELDVTIVFFYRNNENDPYKIEILGERCPANRPKQLIYHYILNNESIQ